MALKLVKTFRRGPTNTTIAWSNGPSTTVGDPRVPLGTMTRWRGHRTSQRVPGTAQRLPDEVVVTDELGADRCIFCGASGTRRRLPSRPVRVVLDDGSIVGAQSPAELHFCEAHWRLGEPSPPLGFCLA